MALRGGDPGHELKFLTPPSPAPFSPHAVFWGGGTVALATSADNFHVLKCKVSSYASTAGEGGGMAEPEGP